MRQSAQVGSSDLVFSALTAAARRNVEHANVPEVDKIDPIALVAASGSHGVDHVVLDWLKIWAPDHPAVALLREKNRESAQFHLRALASLRHAERALTAAGVGYVTFKGPVLAILARSTSCRVYTDIDLMVSPQSLELAVEVLEQAGSAVTSTRRWKNLLESRHAQVSIALPLGVPLDLHWHLCSQPHLRRSFTVEGAEAIIQRSVSMDTPVGPMRVLDWNDMLVHTAGHAGWSGGDRLRWFVDVDSVARGQIDWDTIINRTRAWGLEALVGDVLRQTRELLGTPIPREVIDALRGGGVGWLLRSTERLAPMSGIRGGWSVRRTLRLYARSGLVSTAGAMTRRAAQEVTRCAQQRTLKPVEVIESVRPDDEDWRRPYLSFATTGSAPAVPRRPLTD